MDVNEYLNLVPTENFRKQKFMGFLESILSPMMDLSSVVQRYDAFDINDAAGNQLDIAGEVIGVSRELQYIPASGNPFMPDDSYRLILQLKIAQNNWNGWNSTAIGIYQRLINDAGVNIAYEDMPNGDVGHVAIHVESDSQETAQLVDSIGGFLVPAGVKNELSVSGESVDVEVLGGIAVTGIEFENFVALGGN